MKTEFKATFSVIIALTFSSTLFCQNSFFEYQNKRFVGSRSGTNHPWTLTARTGLIDDFCTQFMNCKDVDTIPRQKIDEWYVSETFKGYWEYLPDDYTNPINNLKTYPLIIYVAGCGVPGDGRYYLNANNGLDRSKGIGRVLNDPLPSYLLQNGRYFSNVAVKKLGTQPASTGDKAQFIILMLQSSGPNRCMPYTLPEPADIDSVIEKAVQRYRIDITRIYLTGVSGGGEIVYQYPAAKDEYARKITAIAPVSSTDWLMGPAAEEYARRIVHNGVGVLSICNRNDFTIGGLTFKMNRLTMLNILSTPGLAPYQADTAFFTYPNQPPGVSNHDAHRKGYYPNISPYYPIIDYGGPLWVDRATGEPYNLYEWFLTKSKLNVLPFHDLDFKVSKGNTDIIIRWKGHADDTLTVYTVERSMDGRNFQAIQTRHANERSTPGLEFRVYDFTVPNAQHLYYRLKMTNKNGLLEYSKTIRLSGQSHTNATIIHTPELNGVITVQFPVKTNTSIKIMDIYGRVVQRNTFLATQSVTLDIRNEKAGTYILQVTNQGPNTQSFKIIKQ